jgi:3,4-dihydroxy 2-butanone 4-phosphate synthase/GTP cyclohydrolase II
MVSNNDSSYETAFTVSVDAKDALTGISASERDMTIKILANPLSKSTELVRPGHIFPLIAKDGGVLIRTGHTEGSVDLCRLAGLAESAVICEIIKEDGTMARRDDLDVFCDKHDLKTVFISDLVEFRLKNESLVTLLDSQETTFYAKPAIKEIFEDHMGHKHTAIIFGECQPEMTVKVHNIGLDVDLLLNDVKHQHFNRSIAYLQKHGGVLLLIEQPAIHNEQMKEYGIGALILQALHVTKIRLISLNKNTAFVGIHGFGLEVVEQVEV